MKTGYIRQDFAVALIEKAGFRLVERFTRMETIGYPDVHWLRIIVGPADPGVFSCKPEIVAR